MSYATAILIFSGPSSPTQTWLMYINSKASTVGNDTLPASSANSLSASSKKCIRRPFPPLRLSSALTNGEIPYTCEENEVNITSYSNRTMTEGRMAYTSGH